jgi:quercetin dioxygenase-like cupin family protein
LNSDLVEVGAAAGELPAEHAAFRGGRIRGLVTNPISPSSLLTKAGRFPAGRTRIAHTGETRMNRTSLGIVIGIALGAAGMSLAQHQNHQKDGESVKVLAAREIKEKVDGHEATATVVEVTIQPGEAGLSHRHPGPGFGYVLEGTYELGIDDQPTQILKAGETFYEPTGCLHRVSKNPSKTGKTRVIAVVVHPRDAKEIAVPEQTKK